MRYPIEWFRNEGPDSFNGNAPGGDGDDYAPSVRRAQHSIPLGADIELYFAPGLYRFGSTVDIFRRVAFIGPPSNYRILTNPINDSYLTATLQWTVGTVGIHVHWPGTVPGGVLPAGENAPASAEPYMFYGENFIMRGFSPTSGLTHHGIRGQNKVHLHGVAVRGFGGNGFHLRADVGDTGNAQGILGSVNLSILKVCQANGCGGYGIYFAGGDSNQCLVELFDANNNAAQISDPAQRAQIYDSCFLGNLWYGCHVGENRNSGVGYRCDNGNARSVFLECYAEGGGVEEDIRPPSIVVGGILRNQNSSGAELEGHTTAALFSTPSLRGGWRSQLSGQQSNQLVFGEVGDPVFSNVALGFGDSARIWRLHYEQNNDRWWELLLNATASAVAMRLQNGETPPTVGGGPQVAEFQWTPWYPRGLYFGGQPTHGASSDRAYLQTERRGAVRAVTFQPDTSDTLQPRHAISWGSAAPTDGAHNQGDVRFNTGGAGGPGGWRCVTAGTPGTWETF